MKNIFLLVSFLVFGLSWSACKKHDFAEGQPSPIIAVSDLRALYRGADVTLTRDKMLGAHQIVGVVISNPDSGNAPSGLVVLQNNRRSQVNGIILPLGTASANYHLGDSLVVEVEGLAMKRVNGALQLTGINESAVTKVSANNPVKPRIVSSFTIKQNPDAYESTLVQVNKATVTPSPKFGDPYAGDKYLVNGADSVILHTEPNAHFATAPLPSLASFAGILMAGQNQAGQRTLQVWPRTLSDVTDVTAPPDPSAIPIAAGDIVITGILSDVKGGDGNYEYFQFMATRNIDFAKTPASVVTCTNGGTTAPNAGDAPGAGWVTGGGRTYKFNLTEGKVNKGEYFYVGGSNKRINGANSTDISSSKWIRAIAYVTNDGDGFGSKSSGLLPNSGNAGGLSIFSGITIDESTAPIDVVFFGGTGKTTIYNATTNKGYRITNNDHYSLKDAATGTDQPFMFQGSNSYIIPHPTPADAGIFIKLGGNFDAASKTWITPRGSTFYTLSLSSAISEIETGNDVTKLSN